MDRTNHHVFQPLLYQVATATLSPADICAPIRWLLRHQANADVLLAEVVSIDPEARVATCIDGKEFNYDFLIVATGARHSYFGHPEWEAVAPGLKSVEDAIELRRRWLHRVRARRCGDVARRARRRNDLRHRRRRRRRASSSRACSRRSRGTRCPRTFVTSTPRQARVILIEGGPRILPAFPEDLSASAERALVELGVDVRTAPS